MVWSAGHNDRIVRSVLFPAIVTIGMDDLDVVITQAFQTLPGLHSQSLYDLDCIDLGHDLCQYGCLVAGTGPNLQYPVGSFQL